METKISLNSIGRVKEFSKIANKYDFDIHLLSGEYVVNGKSIMGIFSLDLLSDIIVYVNDNYKKSSDFFNEILQFTIKEEE